MPVIRKPVPKPKPSWKQMKNPMEIDSVTGWPRFLVRALWPGGDRAEFEEGDVEIIHDGV